MTELLVGTKKGLFVLRGEPARGERFEIVERFFPGDIVEFAIRDARTGRYFASHTSGVGNADTGQDVPARKNTGNDNRAITWNARSRV